ncbi:hypothetical protein NDU88_002374 [Pleurodeles waltl]|uniref:Uncharacterized protein n=1 Tax=Pleurodeles waltl TaxID=8319 RepID=A0AAV7W2N6_PLEWA|nr:hypothetical protein NDU88_002374 [Pleurodeles waltl]
MTGSPHSVARPPGGDLQQHSAKLQLPRGAQEAPPIKVWPGSPGSLSTLELLDRHPNPRGHPECLRRVVSLSDIGRIEGLGLPPVGASLRLARGQRAQYVAVYSDCARQHLGMKSPPFGFGHVLRSRVRQKAVPISECRGSETTAFDFDQWSTSEMKVDATAYGCTLFVSVSVIGPVPQPSAPDLASCLYGGEWTRTSAVLSVYIRQHFGTRFHPVAAAYAHTQ